MAHAVLMAAAGLVELFLGVSAERKALESVARPLSAIDDIAPQPQIAASAAR